MRYSEMTKGMYIVREKELSWARALSGVILYVLGEQDGSLIIQMTEDCVPRGKRMAVGPTGDDGCWHDVTDLVLEANSAIAPPVETLRYPSPMASSYRNFLGLQNVPSVVGEDAQGELCVIGEQTPNGVVFSKSGYYVVAHVDGWYIAYQGFCDYVAPGKSPQLILRVLMLGPNRAFYQAEPIIEACTAAMREDLEFSMNYANNIRMETSEDAAGYQIVPGVGVERLELGVF